MTTKLYKHLSSKTLMIPIVEYGLSLLIFGTGCFLSGMQYSLLVFLQRPHLRFLWILLFSIVTIWKLPPKWAVAAFFLEYAVVTIITLDILPLPVYS